MRFIILIWCGFFRIRSIHTEEVGLKPKPRLVSKIDDGARKINSQNMDDWRLNHIVAIMKWKSTFVCGGSLVTTSTVLTACRCLVDHNNVYWSIRNHFVIAGTHNLSATKGTQVRSFLKFVKHAKCDVKKNPIPADVGLGLLKKQFFFTRSVLTGTFISSNQQTLRWWYDKYISISKTCQVLGWSNANEQLLTKHVLLQNASVQLVNDEACKKRQYFYTNVSQGRINESNSCAVPYGGSSLFEGFSDGTLVCNDYIFGVSSATESHSSRFLHLFCDPVLIMELIKSNLPSYVRVAHDLPSQQDPLSTVSSNKYPFVVSIANVANTLVPVSLCAGSILTDSTVVTTCTCLRGLPYVRPTRSYPNVSVISGITNAFSESQYVQRLGITRVTADCTIDGQGSISHDVGIAFVNGKFRFKTPHVKPLKVSFDKISEFQRSIVRFQQLKGECFMASWGYSTREPTIIRYNIFSEWGVQLLTSEECRRRFCVDHRTMCNDVSLENKAMCGSAFNESQSCFADIGGPLVCGGYFVGIVSYNGELCSRGNIVKIVSVIEVYDITKHIIFNESYHGRKEIDSNSGFRIHVWALWCSIPVFTLQMW